MPVAAKSSNVAARPDTMLSMTPPIRVASELLFIVFIGFVFVFVILFFLNAPPTAHSPSLTSSSMESCRVLHVDGLLS